MSLKKHISAKEVNRKLMAIKIEKCSTALRTKLKVKIGWNEVAKEQYVVKLLGMTWRIMCGS